MKFKYLDAKFIFTILANGFNRLILFVTFIIIISTIPAAAQKKDKSEDVVYLKNGSIIRGTIVENQPGVLLRIRTEGKSEWVFKYEEIEKITKEEISAPKKEVFTKNKGIYGLFQAGLLMGDGGYNSIVVDMNTNLAIGYKFHRLLGVGGAAGIDIIHNIAFIPLTIDLRGNVLDNAVTPYYALQTGFSMPLNDDIESKKMSGGFIANPAIGLQISLSKDVAMLLEAGFRYQQYYVTGQNWRGEYDQTITINRYNFRFGFIF
jgi:hypothetical protein